MRVLRSGIVSGRCNVIRIPDSAGVGSPTAVWVPLRGVCGGS